MTSEIGEIRQSIRRNLGLSCLRDAANNATISVSFISSAPEQGGSAMNEAPFDQSGHGIQPAPPLYAPYDLPRGNTGPQQNNPRDGAAQRFTFSERPTWSLLFSLVGLLLLGLIGVLIISSSAGGGGASLRAAATRTAAQAKAQGSALSAIQTAQAHAIYFTVVPGLGCDKSGAAWGNDSSGSFQCQANGLQISKSATATVVATAWFNGVNGYFPANYRLSVDIDTSNLGSSGCAGIEIRAYGTYGGYGFYVCPSEGSWKLNSYDSQSGTATTLSSGTVNNQSFYAIMAIANGNNETYYIGGSQVTTGTSSATSYNKALGLNVDVSQGSTGSAVFSDFTLVTL
jgi:hypothetical protein